MARRRSAGSPRPAGTPAGRPERPALYADLAEYYDLVYAAKDYRGEAARLLRVLRSALGRRPRSLLDVGCGTGTHLAALARSIPDLAGVDASPAMVRVARRKLGPTVPVSVGDMRSFRLGRSFDAVVCLFSAFGYLPDRAARDATLRAFARHLVPGGVVAVEGWIRPSQYRPRREAYLLTYQGPEAVVVRVSRGRRRGGSSHITMQYLVAPTGGPIVHREELHVNPIVAEEEILGSFRRAGLRAKVLLSGPYRTRGLYVGVAPPAPARSSSR